MIFNSYCEFIGRDLRAQASDLLPTAPVPNLVLDRAWDEASLHNITQLIYDVRKDDALFRREIATPGSFDLMRKQYWDRREYSAVTVTGTPSCNLAPLEKLGFQIEVSDEPRV